MLCFSLSTIKNYYPNLPLTLTHIDMHDTLQKYQHKMKQAETINPLDPVDRNITGDYSPRIHAGLLRIGYRCLVVPRQECLGTHSDHDRWKGDSRDNDRFSPTAASLVDDGTCCTLARCRRD